MKKVYPLPFELNSMKLPLRPGVDYNAMSHALVLNGDMFTATVSEAGTVEQRAHQAVAQEFDPEYLPRLRALMDRVAKDMIEAAALPGEFMNQVAQHRVIAGHYAAEVEKKK